MFTPGWSFAFMTSHAGPSQHRSGGRAHCSKRRDPSQEGRKINLVDLDDTFTERNPVKITVKESWELRHVAKSLRKQFPEGAQEIPDDAEVHFFSDNKRLYASDRIPQDLDLLPYRVLHDGDDGSFRVVWRGNNLKLRKPQREEIAREITAGKSVGSIRESVATLLRETNKTKEYLLQNANQIVLECEGGLKQRLLEGNSWEARNVTEWLCRYIVISMKPADGYFVLRGFNEQYVCHKPCVNNRGYADSSKLKNWLKNEILSAVSSDNKTHRRHINLEDIKLTYHGKTIPRNNHIQPGATIDFEVPRSIEDKFVRVESWLVPLTEICTICNEEKRVSEMPNRRKTTADCDHDATACKRCLGRWIGSRLGETPWDRILCPECPQFLKYEDVRALASREVLKKYDVLATKALLSSIPEFMWCLHLGCEYGQINPAGCSKAKCQGCKRSLCVRHNVPWHRGETCDEYDKRTRRHRKNEEASERKIQEMSKPCPGCERNIDKYSGCDHVTCPCGHQWCWVCFQPYYLDKGLYLFCLHAEGCQYYSDNSPYERGEERPPRRQTQAVNNNVRPRHPAIEDDNPFNHTPRAEDARDPPNRWARRGAIYQNPFLPPPVAGRTDPDQWIHRQPIRSSGRRRDRAERPEPMDDSI
ncbi:uncharacterized protein F4812DRAFT_430138 [Daldinia caldariorum]|uniref:uncharacterized protein n=1 Tax=Daldinia caldariorum TaxID=326644 RepID=UPI00200803B9|nr:uncharacterized protein F4812DRAFT_430138 [Daldinia caldariorum]KAI1467603.1 hypothetical protein F4812DRAFT_430138 [Daldinia caldariorum]